MKLITKFFLGYFILIIFGCDKEIEEGVMKSDLSKDVEMLTDLGSIVLRLSDDTPKHRNNFIKLVNQNFYDGIAFHRVIDNFVIQAGNPTSKIAETYDPEGDPKLSYTIESEFRSNLFHKRGALGAARESDFQNPSRSSSGFQFYIVQKGQQTDSVINKAISRVNFWTAKNNVLNKPELQDDLDAYQRLMLLQDGEESEDDIAQGKIFEKKIDSLSYIELETMQKYSFPEAHRIVYKNIGGEPRLDQNYTVFGEVVKGLNVVDSIAAVATDEDGKPINDVYIIKARMIKR